MARKWWTLLAVSVATFMLLLDITVVNTALPVIQEDLGASFTELQWVIDAYTLVLAAVVLTAGSLADRLGRRRGVEGGLPVFALAFLGAGLADAPARAVQAPCVHRRAAGRVRGVGIAVRAVPVPDAVPPGLPALLAAPGGT